MSLRRLLWVGWGDGASNELAENLDDGWGINVWSSREDPCSEINSSQPAAVLFDCDYPTRECLLRMLNVRLLFPALPMLIVSHDSSAELATWALRVRAWDFLRKPVATYRLVKRLNLLTVAIGTMHGSVQVLPRDMVDESFCRVEILGAPQSTRLAVKFVEENCDQPMSLTEVAQQCGMSRWHFSRVFRLEHGITFQEFLIRKRLERACTLLREGDVSVTEVGLSVGFNDLTHFTRMFHRYVGTRPSQYRKTWRISAVSHAVCEEDVSSSISDRYLRGAPAQQQ